MDYIQILLVLTIFMIGGHGRSTKRGRSSVAVGASSSSTSGNYRSPCDPDNGVIGSNGLFRTQDTFNMHANIFRRSSVIGERPVVLQDFSDKIIERQLVNRRWTKLCEFSQIPNESICREFYANLDLTHKSVNRLHCFVRGVFFDLTPTKIARFLDCPFVRDPEFPYSEAFPKPSYDEVASLLTGNDRTWTGASSQLRHAELTQEFAILHFFVISNIYPVSRHTEVHKDRALFMFAMAMGTTIDLCTFIISVLVNSVENASIRNSLPFGSFITTLCYEAGVKFLDHDEYGSLGPTLNKNILTRRDAQLTRRARAPPPVVVDDNADLPQPPQMPNDPYSMRAIMEAVHGVRTDVGLVHELVNSQIELANAHSTHLQNLQSSVTGIQDELAYYRTYFPPRDGDPRNDGASGSGGWF